MRITELFTAKSIALDVAAKNQAEIIDRLVELQVTHGNITDTEAYKKALYGGGHGRRHGSSDRHRTVHHLLPEEVDARRTPQRHRQLRHGPVLRHRGGDSLCSG